MLTQNELAWNAQVRRRIAISEGERTTMYHDSRGIPTIGIGFNLLRADARDALAKVGVTDIAGVLNGDVALSQNQVNELFDYSFAPIVTDARNSLVDGVFDALSDARRFVICDLVFNMGFAGWGQFVNTRAAIVTAQKAKGANSPDAHALFVAAANDLRQSDWFSQVGDRAKRDCAMMQVGIWCDATGDGSDIL